MHAAPPQLPLCEPVPLISVCSVWPSVFAGSPTSRPAYLICGGVAEFDFVYPIAMSPTRSTARLGMKRKNVFAPSGSNVWPWTTLAATVPPVTLAWYQRTEAFPPVVALHVVFVALTLRWTVWSTHSDSAPPMLEYCACAIARIASTSAAFAVVSAFAGVAFGQQLGASCVCGPLKVDVDGLSQSTWNL